MGMRNNKLSFISHIIVGILLIAGGIFFARTKLDIILSFNSPQKLYNDGYYFTNASKSDIDSIYAVAVHDIIDTGYGSSDKKSELYTIMADDGVYFLEAHPGNKKINSMLETFDNYAKDENKDSKDAPVEYLIVAVKDDTYNQLSDIANEIDPDNTYRNNGTLNTDIYLKNTSLTKEIVVALGGTIILFVMGIGFIILAFTRKSTNNDNYERLCALDERLSGNLGELDNISDYVDKTIGAYVYKDHLILNTKFGLDMYNLKDLVWMFHRITKQKMYALITVSVSYSLQINLYENGRIRECNVTVTHNKKAEGNMEALVEYVGMNYPNALVGFNPETQAAYREFKRSHK